LLKKKYYQQFLIKIFCKDKKSREMISSLSLASVDIFSESNLAKKPDFLLDFNK